MRRFYERLHHGDRPAIALGQAQTQMRALNLDAQLDELADMEQQLTQAGVPEVAVRELRAARTERATRGQADLQGGEDDYRHPRHWAPFVLVGL